MFLLVEISFIKLVFNHISFVYILNKSFHYKQQFDYHTNKNKINTK